MAYVDVAGRVFRDVLALRQPFTEGREAGAVRAQGERIDVQAIEILRDCIAGVVRRRAGVRSGQKQLKGRFQRLDSRRSMAGAALILEEHAEDIDKGRRRKAGRSVPR